jgi:prepilin-type N-terminal cleavage/methylation domain-containing protein
LATRRAQAAFTIVELAVVMAIIGLLLAGAMMTLSAQAEQRAIDETRRRLNAAVEGLVAYAVVNGRLPCPAVVGVLKYGDEDPPAGGACTNGYGGFLPARTIGFQPTDDLFYGLDAWNNRIRYAVSSTAPTVCAGAPAAHFTTLGSMKTYGMSCKPGDLDVCTTAGACAAANRVVAQNTAAFIVYSVGKNGPVTSQYGPDEIENTNADARFVSRTWSGSDAAAGTYDDLMVVVPAGVLYSRLVAAGVLP